MKFKAAVLTINEDLHGEKFSEDVLKQLAESSIGKPIVVFGHNVGIVSDAYVKFGNLVVESRPAYDFFVVPSFTGSDNANIHEFSLTHMPADPSLPSIRIAIDPEGALSYYEE